MYQFSFPSCKKGHAGNHLDILQKSMAKIISQLLNSCLKIFSGIFIVSSLMSSKSLRQVLTKMKPSPDTYLPQYIAQSLNPRIISTLIGSTVPKQPPQPPDLNSIDHLEDAVERRNSSRKCSKLICCNCNNEIWTKPFRDVSNILLGVSSHIFCHILVLI